MDFQLQANAATSRVSHFLDDETCKFLQVPSLSRDIKVP